MGWPVSGSPPSRESKMNPTKASEVASSTMYGLTDCRSPTEPVTYVPSVLAGCSIGNCSSISVRISADVFDGPGVQLAATGLASGLTIGLAPGVLSSMIGDASGEASCAEAIGRRIMLNRTSTLSNLPSQVMRNRIRLSPQVPKYTKPGNI